ncbi:hypothetical protein [Microbacterium sp. zg.B48]|uniref:hypothetical protein n=1 Tax=Microbacterium sp. zg.B48 TaxID=2969408 RepID=UPI0035A8CD0C
MDHDLGPQNAGDGPLLRRVRRHQSWYRAEVLGLPRWGTTRGRSPRELGSVLSDEDAAAGLNFRSPSGGRPRNRPHRDRRTHPPRIRAIPGAGSRRGKSRLLRYPAWTRR